MGEDDGRDTPQQRANFQVFLRANRIFTAALLAVAATATFLFPSVYRFIGLGIAGLLAAGFMLTGVISARMVGFLALAAAALTATAATLASPGWPMDAAQLNTLAISIGTVSVGLVFTSKRTGETDRRVENAVGAFVFAGLLAAALLALVRHTIFADPLAIIACEGLAAFADVAGERWKRPLALASLFPIGILLFDFVPKEQYAPALSAIRFGASHTDVLTGVTAALAGLLGFILSREQKASTTVALFVALLCAAALWVFLVFAGARR